MFSDSGMLDRAEPYSASATIGLASGPGSISLGSNSNDLPVPSQLYP